MRSVLSKLCWMAMFAWLAVLGLPATGIAADENPGGAGDRLQRLERRMNELAERQEQILRRLSAVPEREPRVARQEIAQERLVRASATRNPENLRRPMAGAGVPGAAMAKAHKDLAGLIGLMILGGIICNILLAIWIFTDIRKRGEGSGLFIALALVAGIPAAVIYALVRIGDKKT